MAGATGLEPATSGVTGRRSNQLSYAPAVAIEGATRSAPSGGCQAHLGPMRERRRYGTGVVGDEGLEPPTPSV